MNQRLTSGTKVETEAEHVTRHSAERGLEFESVESVIRYDAATTLVPPKLEERLLRDLEKESAPVPWWKRWFRR